MTDLFQRLAERWLARRGLSVVSTRALTLYDRDAANRPVESSLLDLETEQYLRRDNPRLDELRRRYAATRVGAATHSLWTPSFVDRQVSLAKFRAHSAYVWAYGELPRPTYLKYFIFAQDVARRAPGIFSRLIEDAAFGCHAYDFETLGRVSRDRLDSALELDFIERHLGLLSRPGLRVLDIGAGYGRLAQRMCEASDVADYACVDAIPESTFLCEFYLRRRGIDARARALPLDVIAGSDAPLGAFDIAFNVHSWSECTLEAIEWWMDLVARHEIPYLFVVPNQHDRFLSIEPDRTRKDFLPVIERAGYQLLADEPLLSDPDVRRLLAIPDRLYLFARR